MLGFPKFIEDPIKVRSRKCHGKLNSDGSSAWNDFGITFVARTKIRLHLDSLSNENWSDWPPKKTGNWKTRIRLARSTFDPDYDIIETIDGHDLPRLMVMAALSPPLIYDI